MFKTCSTLEELKVSYHKLMMANHPDKGGSTQKAQEINNEYDKYFILLKNKHVNASGEMYEKDNEETPEEFKDIIAKLMRFEGCYIEIIGCFIWVSGATKEYKEELKALGFKWHSKKQTWYKSPEGYRRFKGRKEYGMDDIRGMYGTTGYSAQSNIKLGEAV